MTVFNEDFLKKVFHYSFSSIIDEGTNRQPFSLCKYSPDDKFQNADWFIGELFSGHEGDHTVYQKTYIPLQNKFIEKYRNNKELAKEYLEYIHSDFNDISENLNFDVQNFIQVMFDVRFSETKNNKYHELYNLYLYLEDQYSKILNRIVEVSRKNRFEKTNLKSEFDEKIFYFLIHSGYMIETPRKIEKVIEHVKVFFHGDLLRTMKELDLFDPDRLLDLIQSDIDYLIKESLSSLDLSNSDLKSLSRTLEKYQDTLLFPDGYEIKQEDIDKLFELYDSNDSIVDMSGFKSIYQKVMSTIETEVKTLVMRTANRRKNENKQKLKSHEKEIIQFFKNFKKNLKLPLMYSRKAENLMIQNEYLIDMIYKNDVEYETAMILYNYVFDKKTLSARKIYQTICEDDVMLPLLYR